MLMDLINRGKVYRFLLKPVSPGRARLAVESSVKHHLEAPDAAFKSNGIAATPKPVAKAKAAPKPVAKAAPKPVAKAAPKPVARATPKPAPKPKAAPLPKPKPVAVIAPADPPLGFASTVDDNSPLQDGLADAFGQNDSSFAETVTRLISSVGNKFKSDKRADFAPDAPPVKDTSSLDLAVDGLPADTAGSGG
jgi:outer membrane biosynthesis protein TonB